jgi:hypothetical protein
MGDLKKFVLKLQELNICTLQPHKGGKAMIQIQQPKVLAEIFKVIFILYVTPYESSIQISVDKDSVHYTGNFVKLAIFEQLSPATKAVLEILLIKDDDAVYEYAFNSLLCVYIGSLLPLKIIYPNTYIVDLGDKSHEIDIFFASNDKNAFLIETTRGFAKEKENVLDTHSWHFKKAVFRKWMIEKFYGLDCKLCYLTLRSLESTHLLQKNTIDNTLEDLELPIINKKNIVTEVLQREKGSIKVITMAIERNPIDINKMDDILENMILKPLFAFVKAAFV